MRKPKPFPEGALDELKAALDAARSKAQYQRLLCLWLRAAVGLTVDEIALAIGWHRTTVMKLHSRYARLGDAVLAEPGRGGRRRQNLSRNEEFKLLRRLREEAAPACVINSARVHAAYEKAVGRRVPPSTISRMLARHGWTRHMIVAMSNDTNPPKDLPGAVPDPAGTFYEWIPDFGDGK
jgi:transposase